MTDSNRIAYPGGHGKVGLLAAGTLGAAGYKVDSVIRNPTHVVKTGAPSHRTVIFYGGDKSIEDAIF